MSHSIANGSFIQIPLVRGWGESEWRRECESLREAGMRYLVVYPALDSLAGEAYYPTQISGVRIAEPVFERALAAAQGTGMQLFLGLNYHNEWFQKSASDPKWLIGQMTLGNQVAQELTELYAERFSDAIAGWYWVWEVDNLNFKGRLERQILTEALETNVAFLKRLPLRRPLMLCPFMNYRCGTPEEYAAMWAEVFAGSSLGDGDIFAPQDCVGAGGLTMDNYVEWFRVLRTAVDRKPGLRFWSDTETFRIEDWTAAPLDRFVKQLEEVEPYVDASITFAYSHYYSPQSSHKGFHRAYCEYVRTGSLPAEHVPSPQSLTLRHSEQLTLSWSGHPDVCGYEVLRDGGVVGRTQVMREVPDSVASTTVELDPMPGLYQVRAYGFTGQLSQPSNGVAAE